MFEAGYNDEKNSTKEEMAEYAEKIVDEAKTAGIIPILLNPNATPEAYSDTVKFGDVMKQTAEKNLLNSLIYQN